MRGQSFGEALKQLACPCDKMEGLLIDGEFLVVELAGGHAGGVVG